MVMEAAFPRGGRSKTPDKQAQQADDQSQKKRRKDDSKKATAVRPDSDFLFGKSAAETSAKRRKTSTSSSASPKSNSGSDSSKKLSMMEVGGGGVVRRRHGKKEETVIEALSFNKLAKDTKLFGTVREVHDEFAVVSLPNLLTGYLLQEGGTPLSKCLAIGQSMAFIVVKIVTEHVKGGQQRRRIQVSAKPSLINGRDTPSRTYPIRGQIKSVEDHGCLVDIGYNRTGFLPFRSVRGEYTVIEDSANGGDDGDDDNDQAAIDAVPDGHLILQKGRVYDFLVNSDKKETVTALSLSKKTYTTKLIPTSPPPLSSLCPGWLVQAKIDTLARNGLCITFFGEAFRGAVEISHIGGHFIPDERNESTEWKAIFNKVQTFTARIVAVDVATKLIRLSLQQHLVEMKPPTELPPVGSTIKGCRVIRLDAGIGALLAFPESHNKERAHSKVNSDLQAIPAYHDSRKVAAAYVHISKAIDENDAQLFTKEFAPSTVHDVRILSTQNLIDGVASGACSKSLVDAHVLTHSDLQPGRIYRQVAISAQLEGGSVLVNLGSDVRGLIPPLQLFETTAESGYRKKLLRAKFAVGAKIDVRVLWVDAARKKCLLTSKRGLMQEVVDPITAYEDIKHGQRAVGYVSKIDDRGLFVTFCNRVYGRVTKRSLAADLGIDDHRQDYSVGDVVSCYVLNRKCRVQTQGRGNIDNMDDDAAAHDDDSMDATSTFWELTLGMKADDAGDDKDVDMVRTDASPQTVHLTRNIVIPPKSIKILHLVKGKMKNKVGTIPGYAIVSMKSKHLLKDQEITSMPSYIECKLPYDQLLDEYDADDLESPEALDELAEGVLKVGKKINQQAIVLTDPNKLDVEYKTGVGSLVVLSIRKKLVSCISDAAIKAESNEADGSETTGNEAMVPHPTSNLYKGAKLLGYVTRIDQRFGGFVRFLDGLTGLVPKTSRGIDLPLYGTIVTRVVTVDDTKMPPKILLETAAELPRKTSPSNGTAAANKKSPPAPYKLGDIVDKLEISQINFHHASLTMVDDESPKHARFEMQASHKKSPVLPSSGVLKKSRSKTSKKPNNKTITKDHPFHGLQVGEVLKSLVVVSVKKQKNNMHAVLLSDWTDTDRSFMTAASETDLPKGAEVDGIITSVATANRGLHVQISPAVHGFIPALEFSDDVDVLNALQQRVKIGSRIKCHVLENSQRSKKGSDDRGKNGKGRKRSTLYLGCLPSATASESSKSKTQPSRGDVLTGMINRSANPKLAPSVMIDFRGGLVGRCCICELDSTDEWVNMPLGRMAMKGSKPGSKNETNSGNNDDGTNATPAQQTNGPSTPSTSDGEGANDSGSPFAHGRYVSCRVLKAVRGSTTIEASLRQERMEGDLDDDPIPEEGDTIQGYVVHTDKKGCFVRLSRTTQARVILKELCDGFLQKPEVAFPMGRLVVGKVKSVREAPKKGKKTLDSITHLVDLDMRESVMLDEDNKLTYDDIEIKGKYKGTVTRIETYGVFVRLDGSEISGLAHKSECSDAYVTSVEALYDPGDLVKVLVVKKDDETKRVGFSLKASHFADDEDSDDDSDAMDVDDLEDGDGDDGSDGNEDDDDGSDAVDSDDENFVSKLAKKMNKSKAAQDSSDDSDDDDDSGSDDDSDDEEDNGKNNMDTDVGFDWLPGKKDSVSKSSSAAFGATSNDGDDSESDDSDNDSDDEADDGKKSKTSSKKKQALRRKEEREISQREAALADGTADENPETAADFERLIAGSPNSSELWIRFMAFYLSMADIPAARKVAQRAFDRIEFREEKEKLNVWTALLTLELKYGTEETLNKTMERACQHNNPKHVHLRVCELLAKDVKASTTPDSVARADAMFAKMCKKFKSKKKVWIAHVQFLLEVSRQQEAHELLKRALLSLPTYKHVEAMTRFAQLEFELGSAERGRTLFDGLTTKNPKRLDLFFVYLDKEVKFGDVTAARHSIEKRVEAVTDGKRKLSDKQMKSLFKKWYRIEEEHGTEESCQRVKEAARAFVERTS